MNQIKEGLDWMRDLNLARQRIEICEVIAEASQALARLDAERLEELASACQALSWNREPGGRSDPGSELNSEEPKGDSELLRQARKAAGDMRIFGRVLESTRTNLVVMRRMRQLRQGKIEYSEAQARGWAPPEPGYGDD